MYLWLGSLLGSGTVASAAACWIAALLWASLGVSYRGEWIVRWIGAGALQALVIHAPGPGFPISAAIAHAARNGGWGMLLCLAIAYSLPPSLPPFFPAPCLPWSWDINAHKAFCA